MNVTPNVTSYDIAVVESYAGSKMPEDYAEQKAWIAEAMDFIDQRSEYWAKKNNWQEGVAVDQAVESASDILHALDANPGEAVRGG